MTTAQGYVPASPLDTAIVRDYASEHRRSSVSWAASLEICPEVSAMAASGQYLSATQTGDLDLDANPQIITAVPLGSTEYQRAPYTLGRRTYDCYRYTYNQVTLPDRQVSELAAQTGFDLEQYVMRLTDVAARSTHRHLVYTAAGTQGNYATGHYSDPGNITSAAFDLFGLLETVGTALDDAGTWSYGDPLDVTVGFDVWPYLWTNTQVINAAPNAQGAGFAATRYGDASALEAVMGQILGGGVRVRRAMGFYTTSATKTRYLSGKIAFTRPFRGDGEAGFFGTLVPAQDNAGILNVREEYHQSIPGRIIYSDGWYGVHVDDSQAGYLAQSLLT